MKNNVTLILLLSIFTHLAAWAQYSASSELPYDAPIRKALVICNAAYTHLPPQINPSNDADSITFALKQAGFKVDVHKNLTFLEMRRALSLFFSNIGHRDTYVFYFAGHGVYYKGNNCLAPIDASGQADCLGLQQFMSDSLKGRGMLFLDADFSNSNEVLYPELPPDNCIVAYAGVENVLDYSDECRQNSPFCAALSRAISKQANITLDQHQQKEVHNLLQEAFQNIRIATKNEQKPVFISRLSAPFYFHLYAKQ